jgi:hypothetical protein
VHAKTPRRFSMDWERRIRPPAGITPSSRLSCVSVWRSGEKIWSPSNASVVLSEILRHLDQYRFIGQHRPLLPPQAAATSRKWRLPATAFLYSSLLRIFSSSDMSVRQ